MKHDKELDTMLNALAAICGPLVKHIEEKVPSTKDHYSDYMTAILTLANKVGQPTQSVKLAIGVALQRAGANKAGVTSALRVLGAL